MRRAVLLLGASKEIKNEIKDKYEAKVGIHFKEVSCFGDKVEPLLSPTRAKLIKINKNAKYVVLAKTLVLAAELYYYFDKFKIFNGEGKYITDFNGIVDIAYIKSMLGEEEDVNIWLEKVFEFNQIPETVIVINREEINNYYHTDICNYISANTHAKLYIMDKNTEYGNLFELIDKLIDEGEEVL